MTLLLLIALALPASAGDPSFPLPPFSEGLHTRYSANAIPDGALSEALNVLVDQDVNGVVVARTGYSKYNTSSIGAYAIRGLWPFDASDGTKYLVAHASATFYKTTGDGTWTAITGLNGFSLTKDFDCVQTIGSLYCGNGDTVISWNGTSTSTVSGAPIGNLVGRFRNRLLIAGISGSKARLRGSGELDATDWTVQVPGVSTTPFNIAFGGADDGEDITCLMGAFQDVFIVGKRNSLWGLYGFGRTDFQVREISREVGCIEQRSVREKNNCLYWMSQRGIEKFCGAVIERIGDPIRDKIDIIIAAAGNARSGVDTLQADFEAGNLTASGAGAPMSATRIPASITVSTWGYTASGQAALSSGTFNQTTATASGIRLSSYTFSDTFDDGSLAWTCEANANDCPTETSGEFFCDFTAQGTRRCSAYKAVESSTGAWSIFFRVGNDGGGSQNQDMYLHFMSDGLNLASNNGYSILYNNNNGNATYSLYRRTSGSGVLIASGTGTSSLYQATMTVVRASDGRMVVTAPGALLAATDATHTNGSYAIIEVLEVGVGASLADVMADNVDYYRYRSSGTYTSAIFDTGFSTNTPGRVILSSSVPSGSVGVSVRSSTSPNNDMWTAWQTVSDASPISLPFRYRQLGSTFTTTASTLTPTLASFSLEAATTGYFISQCRNPGTAITSWGIFNCSTELNDGAISFAISTGASCGAATAPTGTWNTQTNNTAIAIATAPYVAYRLHLQPDVTTDTPRALDCSIAWNEGASRPPVAAQVYRDRYYLAYTSGTATGSVNDHILVLDKNDKWTLFNNHNCYTLALYNRKLYCGSSTSVGQAWLLDNGTDDDGTAITSRVRTKAFNIGMPERRKKFKKLYLDLEPSPDPTQTISLTARYTLERSTPTYSLSTVDLNEDPGSILTPKFPFTMTNPTTGRYIQLELESSALNSPWRLFGGRLYYSPLEPE